MRNALIVLLVLVSSLWFAACNETPQQPKETDDKQLKESLEKTNRYLINDEEEDIANYIARHQLDMVESGTGLRYQILKAGEGETIRQGQTVTFDYELRNIMGDIVYSSENDGEKCFTVGHGNVETGLDEAMRYLHKGDVAIVIIPSHLGYGMLGDQKSIPAYSTLIYTLKIKEVKE